MAGDFDTYAERVQSRPALREHTLFLGRRPNLVTSLFPVCDVFLNPPRIGGGMAAQEAMIAGVPVITLAGGDVGYATGPEFHIATWDEALPALIALSDPERLAEAREKIRNRLREMGNGNDGGEGGLNKNIALIEKNLDVR